MGRDERNRGRERAAAKARHRELAPQLASYTPLNHFLRPFVTVAIEPGYSNEVVTIDSRGYRISRLGTETARSDDAPENAAFVFGGSFTFGVGASSDSKTLASALWRRTGIPYVNLGITRATSTQELIGAVPFMTRTTTFLVCSGLNNMARSGHRSAAIDPLFGPQFLDPYFRKLRKYPLTHLAKLASSDSALFNEGKKRVKRRARSLTRSMKPALRGTSGGAAGGTKSKGSRGKAIKKVQTEGSRVASAAAIQLRDLRILRRSVPDDAQVIFALQPFATVGPRQLSPEEVEIFELLDQIQGKEWQQTKGEIELAWDDYAELLEQGCEELEVPFIDLSRLDFPGWCYVDRTHMTDTGYDAVAAALEPVLPHDADALSSAPAPEPVMVNAGATAAPEGDEEADDDANIYPLW